MACLPLHVLTSAGPALPDKLFPLTIHLLLLYKTRSWGFPGGPVVKNPPANATDMGPTPGLGRSYAPWSNQVHVPQLLSPHA